MSWARTRPRPRLRPLENLPRRVALDDAFWGLCFSALFLAPHLRGFDRGAPLARVLGQIGMDEAFCQSLRCGLTAGSAAVVVLCDPSTADQVTGALARWPYKHTRAPITDRQFDTLREVFAR
jgi:uncharacterized membrane protein